MRKYGRDGQVTDGNSTRLTPIACCINKATNTHSIWNTRPCPTKTAISRKGPNNSSQLNFLLFIFTFNPIRNGNPISQFCDPKCRLLLHVWPLVFSSSSLRTPLCFVCCTLFNCYSVLWNIFCIAVQHTFTGKLQKTLSNEMQQELVKHWKGMGWRFDWMTVCWNMKWICRLK